MKKAISLCFVGSTLEAHVQRGFESLEKEYGVLDWNGLLNQYEIGSVTQSPGRPFLPT